jgi:membrane-associated HD superfamily phosphohydrolase
MSQNERFAVFFGIWVVLGTSSFVFFTFNNDAPLKRRLHRFFIILIGVLFVIFTTWMSGSTQALGFLIPAVFIITILNLMTTKLCNSCGSTLYNAN